MTEATTRCIECGGSVGSLNEDEDGVPCPACAERLLETLPGVFHKPWAEAVSDQSEGAYAEEACSEDAPAEHKDLEGGDHGRFGK